MSDIDRIIKRSQRLIERHKDTPTLMRDSVLDDLFGKPGIARELHQGVREVMDTLTALGIQHKAIKGGDPVAAALDNPEQASYQDLCKAIDAAISGMDIEGAKKLLAALSDQIDQFAKAADNSNGAGVPSIKTRVKNGIRETFDPALHTWLRDSPKGRR